MRADIVYVHHSCFILKLAEKTFLFDYPGDAHLPPAAADVIQRHIAGSDLFVFISHSHDDHFNPNLIQIVKPAACARFVVSDDVPDMYPEAVPEDALVVEPDETYRRGDIAVETLMANDLGVAFLIEIEGIVVYFGADLAEWIWPDMEEAAVRFTETFFQEAIDRVRARNVHIAFHNVDKRLDNLGGGLKFLERVRPRVFVPMHGFGDTAWYGDLVYPCDRRRTQIFIYRNPGDLQVFSLEAKTSEHRGARRKT